MFKVLSGRPVSKECTVSRTPPTETHSSAWLEDTALVQLSIILAVEENTVVCIFRDAGPATKSSPGTEVSSVTNTVINRSVAKAFESSAFQTATEPVAYKFLAEPHVANNVATRTIGITASTVLLGKCFRSEVEKRSFANA